MTKNIHVCKYIRVTHVHVYYIIYDMNEEETTQWNTYQEDNEYKRGHYSNTSLHTSHMWLIILCDRILLLSFHCCLKLRPHTLLSKYINNNNKRWLVGHWHVRIKQVKRLIYLQPLWHHNLSTMLESLLRITGTNKCENMKNLKNSKFSVLTTYWLEVFIWN